MLSLFRHYYMCHVPNFNVGHALSPSERRLQSVSPPVTDGQPGRRPDSFLGDRSKVTGIRDVLSRMDASNSGQ